MLPPDPAASAGEAFAVVPVDADHVAAPIFFGSTRLPRLSAITSTSPTEVLMDPRP